MKLTKTIDIAVKHMGPYFVSEVRRTVVNTFTGKCTREYGYITAVSGIKVVSAEVQYCTSDIAVVVVFDAETDKPEIGSVVQATATTFIKQGVIFETSLYKIFVPGCSGYGDSETASIEIIDTRYDKNQYNCIGKISGSM